MSSVAVIGLGYVGLPLAIRAAEVGHNVIGVDVSDEKVERLGQGQSYIEDVASDRIKFTLEDGTFRPRTPAEVSDERIDIFVITVPTPVDGGNIPDLSYVISAAEFAASHLQPRGTVVLESTTYPGTTQELVANVICRATGLQPDRDYYLGFSPERINPGDPIHTLETTPKIVSGIGPIALDIINRFYSTLVETTVPVSSPRVAELAKVFENTFAFVNVALVNELALICSQLRLDVDEVLDAAATKGHNFMRFRPGPGVGGHCLPVDPLYLAHHMRVRFGTEFLFAELADKVNSGMPQHIMRRVQQITGKDLCETKVLVLGLAYKPDVADIRESPSVELVDLLAASGASVTTCDPYVSQADISPEDAMEAADGFDVAIIATNHTSFDYEALLSHAPAILDTRNVYPQGTEKVHKM